MLQIKDLTITHRKDFRIILEKFNLTLNDKDKAVIIGEEGNGKSTLNQEDDISFPRSCYQHLAR